MHTDPQYIILLGPPASGKGTQATKLRAALELPHIASGDLFRYNLKHQTELGLKAKGYMEQGELVPDAITIRMVMARLRQPDCAGGALLDGFPRTIAQAEALEAALAEEEAQVNLVLNIVVPDDVLVERVTGRRLCRECGASYHVKFLPPQAAGICDKCGGELYQRPDDTEETVRTRIAVYWEQTSPLVDYYRQQSVLVDIDGNQSVEKVTESLTAKVAPIMVSRN
ncbi:MAG TPA: adenylate kinase [Thermoflexia bacterium]|nr:adenylate kinase [Thermoflexia bacterium]